MAGKNQRCSNGHRRRAARAAVLARREPCGICGRPIDYSLTTWTDPKDGKEKRHPMSAEVDEIVPVSLGGSPYDTDNMRAAHRICNQRRGNSVAQDSAPSARSIASGIRKWTADWI